MSILPLLLHGLAGFVRLYVQMQFKSLYSEFLGLLLWKLERWWNLFVMVLKTGPDRSVRLVQLETGP